MNNNYQPISQVNTIDTHIQSNSSANAVNFSNCQTLPQTAQLHPKQSNETNIYNSAQQFANSSNHYTHDNNYGVFNNLKMETTNSGNNYNVSSTVSNNIPKQNSLRTIRKHDFIDVPNCSSNYMGYKKEDNLQMTINQTEYFKPNNENLDCANNGSTPKSVYNHFKNDQNNFDLYKNSSSVNISDNTCSSARNESHNYINSSSSDDINMFSLL